MKPRLFAFLLPMAASVILTVLLLFIFQNRQGGPPPADTGAENETATLERRPPPDKPPAGRAGESAEEKRERWLSMTGTPEGLAVLDRELRGLPAAPLPGLCGDLLEAPEPARTPLLRLLGIRWAELDGKAALEWAHAHFHGGKPGEWDPWLTDLFSAWLSTQPEAASDWLTEVLSSDESKESWSPSGRSIPFEKWARPGNVVALARANLDSLPKGALSFQFVPTAPAFARQITSMDEVRALRVMVEETGLVWPQKEQTPGGSLVTRNSGAPALEIAAAFEAAWARLDPSSWRAYAEKRVIGATGTNLPLDLAVDDARQADDPAAVARAFFAKPCAALADLLEIRRLLDAVEERQPGAGWALVQQGALPEGLHPSIKAAIAQRFAQDRHPDDPDAALADLATLTDSKLRDQAGEAALMNTTAQDSEAPAGIDVIHTTTTRLQAAGWTPERIAAFHELQASAPIHKNR